MCTWRLILTVDQPSSWIDWGNENNREFSVLCSAIYSKYKHRAALTFWFGSHIGSAIYTLYWDLINDWGLLKLGSKNYLLRNELIYGHGSRNWIYYLAIIEDTILRFAWLAHHFLKTDVWKSSLGPRIHINRYPCLTDCFWAVNFEELVPQTIQLIL